MLAGCGSDPAASGPDTAAGTDVVAADLGVLADTGTAPKPCTTANDCPAPDGKCRASVCQAGVGCVLVVLLNGALCDDGDQCTTGDRCTDGACQSGAPTDCDDGEVCTVDSCATDKGCVHNPAADGEPCDDGDSCTANDACAAGKCEAGKSICACSSDNDCAGLGDKCTGAFFCDSKGDQSECRPNKSLQVKCSPAADTLCTANQCDPETGTCKPKARNPGKACDDGQVCTKGEVCAAAADGSGQCGGGTDICGCKSNAECAGQDDGNLCNGVPFCNKALSPPQCELNPATVVKCKTAADTGCAKNACNPSTGVCQAVPEKDGKGCNDDDPCTGSDTCKAGVCKGKTGTCPCKTDSDCKSKDDGDACNGTMYCDKSGQGGAGAVCKLNPATIVVCQSVGDSTCLKNTCDKATGKCAMTPQKDGIACEDGDSCTVNDACKSGTCTAGSAAQPCACKESADCAKVEDGKPCNGTLYCDKTKTPYTCKVDPATVVKCTAAFDTACTRNTCQDATGKCALQPANQGLACEDGDPCTKGEACKLGKCTPAADICDCKHASDCVGKGGDKCAGPLFCDKSKLPWVCATNPAAKVVCDKKDDGFCRVRACNSKTGVCDLVATNAGIACDDGSACTVGETCQNGSCSGAPKKCDDGLGCTKDACVGKSGCVFTPDDKLCADGKPCTNDSCVLGKGCVYVDRDGKCDDGDICTISDTCGATGTAQAGKCAGKPKVCDDKDPCTKDTCDPKKGCVADKGQRYVTLTHEGGKYTRPFGAWSAGGDLAWGGISLNEKLPHHLWLRRQTPAGKLVWHRKVASEALTYMHRGDIVDLGGGSAVLVASMVGHELASHTFLVGVDPGGQVQFKQQVASPINTSAHRATRVGKSHLVLGGDDLLVRLTTSGVVLWTKPPTNILGTALAKPLRVRALAPLGEDVIAGGASGKFKPGAGWIGRVDPLGKMLWMVSPFGAQRVDAIAVTSAGITAIGGSSLYLGTLAGKKQKSKTLNLPKDSEGLAMVGRSDGVLILAYAVAPVGLAGLLAIDAAGAQKTKLPLGIMASQQQVRSLRVDTLTGGDIALVEAIDKAGKQVAQLQRRDPWANESCSKAGDCADKTLKDCDDGNVCTDDFCFSTLGCHHAINTLPCDDGDICTEGDTCAQAKCKPSTLPGGSSGASACDDGNLCTKDACDMALGCTHTALAGTCDDGDLCTYGDHCALGLCKPGKSVSCDDGNACTDEACDSKKGCQKSFNATPCQAGTCTFDDKCDKGFCKSSGKSAFMTGWYGTPKAERGVAIDRVGQDGFILTGRTYQKTDPDGWITRVGPDGKVKWSHAALKPPYGAYGKSSGTAKAVSNDQLRDVIAVPGGFIAVGYTSLCWNRSWAMRFDHAGKTVWNRLFNAHEICRGSGDHASWAYAIAPGHDGTYAIAGTARLWPHHGANHFRWVARINESGHRIRTVNLGSYGYMRDVTALPGGGYLVAGYYNASYRWSTHTARLNANLGKIWSTGWDSGGHDYLLATAPAADGGAYSVGYTAKNTKGGNDGLLIRYNAVGKVAWTRLYGGKAHDYLYGVHAEAGDRLVLGGTTFSKGAGGDDYWLISAGEKVAAAWERTYGSATSDSFAGLVPLVHGGYGLASTGFQKGGVSPDVQVRMVDAFGHTSCGESGVCHGKPGPTCDDKNPATADSCDPKKGCVHK